MYSAGSGGNCPSEIEKINDLQSPLLDSSDQSSSVVAVCRHSINFFVVVPFSLSPASAPSVSPCIAACLHLVLHSADAFLWLVLSSSSSFSVFTTSILVWFCLPVPLASGSVFFFLGLHSFNLRLVLSSHSFDAVWFCLQQFKVPLVLPLGGARLLGSASWSSGFCSSVLDSSLLSLGTLDTFMNHDG
ncbi:uncharacterized protein DS421_12g373680 [Arachis hypogaea]|nr:uncharacterized protein DS421_12g373680 [Arachis hypogaea]